MAIEKLTTEQALFPDVVADKLDELIEQSNKQELRLTNLVRDFENHIHHGRELQFGTDGPVVNSETPL